MSLFGAIWWNGLNATYKALFHCRNLTTHNLGFPYFLRTMWGFGTWLFCDLLKNYSLQHCWQPLKCLELTFSITTRVMPKCSFRNLAGGEAWKQKQNVWQWLYVKLCFVMSLQRKMTNILHQFALGLPHFHTNKSLFQQNDLTDTMKNHFLHIGAWNYSFGTGLFLQTNTQHQRSLKHILTCPVEDESHMAVVYCLSSSGALSFRSNVSIATTTLDTWLGLSERTHHKQAVQNTALQDACRQLCWE